MLYAAASVAAYELLKTRLRDGHYPPGTCLRAAEISEELGISATPAREGLIRLTAEGLAEEIPGHGFFAPKLTEADLRDYYELNLNYATMAIARADPLTLASCPPAEERLARLQAGKNEPDFPDKLVVETQAFFDHLVLASKNHLIHRAQGNLDDRLFLARRIEPRFLSDMIEELNTLWLLCRDDKKAGVRRAICRYHQRRFRILSQIVISINRL